MLRGMTTWREATSAKTERQRRERRYFTPDKLSPVKCAGGCGLRLPEAMLDRGERAHATCTAEFKALVKLAPPVVRGD